jgi:hypothetical protein
MRRVLGDGTLRARLGSNAAARADAMFDRRTMVDAFKRVVESVVGAEGVRERAPWARARVS